MYTPSSPGGSPMSSHSRYKPPSRFPHVSPPSSPSSGNGNYTKNSLLMLSKGGGGSASSATYGDSRPSTSGPNGISASERSSPSSPHSHHRSGSAFYSTVTYTGPISSSGGNSPSHQHQYHHNYNASSSSAAAAGGGAGAFAEQTRVGRGTTGSGATWEAQQRAAKGAQLAEWERAKLRQIEEDAARREALKAEAQRQVQKEKEQKRQMFLDNRFTSVYFTKTVVNSPQQQQQTSASGVAPVTFGNGAAAGSGGSPTSATHRQSAAHFEVAPVVHSRSAAERRERSVLPAAATSPLRQHHYKAVLKAKEAFLRERSQWDEERRRDAEGHAAYVQAMRHGTTAVDAPSPSAAANNNSNNPNNTSSGAAADVGNTSSSSPQPFHHSAGDLSSLGGGASSARSPRARAPTSPAAPASASASARRSLRLSIGGAGGDAAASPLIPNPYSAPLHPSSPTGEHPYASRLSRSAGGPGFAGSAGPDGESGRSPPRTASPNPDYTARCHSLVRAERGEHEAIIEEERAAAVAANRASRGAIVASHYETFKAVRDVSVVKREAVAALRDNANRRDDERRQLTSAIRAEKHAYQLKERETLAQNKKVAAFQRRRRAEENAATQAEAERQRMVAMGEAQEAELKLLQANAEERRVHCPCDRAGSARPSTSPAGSPMRRAGGGGGGASSARIRQRSTATPDAEDWQDA